MVDRKTRLGRVSAKLSLFHWPGEAGGDKETYTVVYRSVDACEAKVEETDSGCNTLFAPIQSVDYLVE